MNALTVQNPCYKCDLRNKNDYQQENNINYYNYYYTEIILYMYKGVTIYTPQF